MTKDDLSKEVRRFKELTSEILLKHVKESIGKEFSHTVRVSKTDTRTRAHQHKSLSDIVGVVEIVDLSEDRAGFTVMVDAHEPEYTHRFVYRFDDETLASVLLRTALLWED